MIRVYGLHNCDTCRKARRFLDRQGVDYRFVDLREEPPLPGQVQAWLALLGERRLLNRRSNAWREVGDKIPGAPGHLARQHLAALISRHPLLVKRPLFVEGARMLAGFDQERLQTWLEERIEDRD